MTPALHAISLFLGEADADRAQRLINAMVAEEEALGGDCTIATGLAATLSLTLMFVEEAPDREAALRLVIALLEIGARANAGDSAGAVVVPLAPRPDSQP